MGVIDKFLNVMNLNPDDEDYDEDEYFDEYDDPEEEEIEKPKRSFLKSKKSQEEEDTYLPLKDEEPRAKERSVKSTPKVTPFRTTSNRKQGGDMGVCVIKPVSYDDAQEITDTLLKGRTVVLNLEGLNYDITQRIIDFTFGSSYALDCNFQKITNNMFLIAPPNVEVSGDFAEMLNNYDANGFLSGL